jgi:mRNA interferase RelE/StbE
MRMLDPTREALNFVMGLPAKQFRQVVGTILGLLKNPALHDSIQLSGSPYRRVDIGEYRVVYDYSDEALRILVVGKRNDDEVYRALKRKT